MIRTTLSTTIHHAHLTARECCVVHDVHASSGEMQYPKRCIEQQEAHDRAGSRKCDADASCLDAQDRHPDVSIRLELVDELGALLLLRAAVNPDVACSASDASRASYRQW